MKISWEGQEANLTTGFARGSVAGGGLPPGGTPGQILTKESDADFDVGWKDAPAQEDIGVETFNGRKGQVIPKSGDYNASMVGARADTWLPTASDIGAVPDSRTVNGKALSSNITITASDIGAVSQERTINGKALSADVTLTAEDIGVPTMEEVEDAIESSLSGIDSGVASFNGRKGAVVPTDGDYTASMVGALPETTKIPTKTSELTNDSGYITELEISDEYQGKLIPDDSIEISGNNIKVTNPVEGVTQAEYDALPEAEKENGLYIITDAPDKVAELEQAINRKANKVDVVPNTRKINGKPLSADITLKTSDLTNDSGYITEAEIPTGVTIDEVNSAINTAIQSAILDSWEALY